MQRKWSHQRAKQSRSTRNANAIWHITLSVNCLSFFFSSTLVIVHAYAHAVASFGASFIRLITKPQLNSMCPVLILTTFDYEWNFIFFVIPGMKFNCVKRRQMTIGRWILIRHDIQTWTNVCRVYRLALRLTLISFFTFHLIFASHFFFWQRKFFTSKSTNGSQRNGLGTGKNFHLFLFHVFLFVFLAWNKFWPLGCCEGVSTVFFLLRSSVCSFICFVAHGNWNK